MTFGSESLKSWMEIHHLMLNEQQLKRLEEAAGEYFGSPQAPKDQKKFLEICTPITVLALVVEVRTKRLEGKGESDD